MRLIHSTPKNQKERHAQCDRLQREILKDRNLIIAANRGPVSFVTQDDGEVQAQRGGGGLVTALMSLAEYVDASWIACALTPEDINWEKGFLPITDDDQKGFHLRFLSPTEEAYVGYYNVIANPLLWFLQHSMWDFVSSPTIDYATWQAWNNGYVEINRQFADAIATEIESDTRHPLVMLQDYHLYLTPQLLRERLSNSGVNRDCTITHFIHIPWPGPEDWGILPAKMRRAILEGLCSLDLLGFQTQEDGFNFIRSVESHLPGSVVTFKYGRVWYKNQVTYVRDFPISIDVEAITRAADSDEVSQYRQELEQLFGDHPLIVRVDRTEPSKNIVRGFQAFDELLELYPEHRGKVQFLALLVPSRMEVVEYQSYMDDLMAAAGRVNVHHGDSEWEPVRVIVGENYPRALAALQLYDVLLVNSVADGMNLVAKEGPSVNQRNGVVILSERTGARQQLEVGALVISPCDVYSTAEAFHQALIMPDEERKERAERLRSIVERADIVDWLCRQLETIQELKL
jgi:trehalose 6-phosphate synthase